MSSWIREHFATFVIPSLEAMRTRRAGEPAIQAKNVRFVPPPSGLVVGEEPFSREIRLLKTYSDLVGIYPLRLEKGREKPPTDDGWRRIRNSFLAVASYAKKVNKKLLLTGRDVWLYEVLAHRYHVNSLFIPEVSRNTTGDKATLKLICDLYAVSGEELLFDTGFYGSIPKAFSDLLKKSMDFLLLSQSSGYGSKHQHQQQRQQIFPLWKGSRDLALWIEYLPKYWHSGRAHLYTTGYEQTLSDPGEFVEAAILTACLWRGFNWEQVRKYVWGDNLGAHFRQPFDKLKPVWIPPIAACNLV